MLIRVVGVLGALLLCAASATPALGAPVDVSVVKDSGTGEPEIEVSPKDPDTIVVGKNDKGVAISHDRGRTFKQVELENPGDHVLTVGPDGTFWYSALDGDVRRSTDGGDTWTTVGNWVGEVAAQSSTAQPLPGGQAGVREAGCNAPEPEGPVEPVPDQGPGPHAIGCDRPRLYADKNTGTLYATISSPD